MNNDAVGALYDALERFESSGTSIAYPVHKSLDLEPGVNRDIYDWLADHVGIRSGMHVLDAGCGVGFGVLKLAELGASRVTGISLSANEVAAARKAGARSEVCGAVEFFRGSFDELPRSTYDLIIAVESLKHSIDLAGTLRSLIAALKPGGKIAIVEDVYRGRPDDKAARNLMQNWHLRRLYREEDYVAALGSANCRRIDLTSHVRYSSQSNLLIKRFALTVALSIVTRSTAPALRAFIGGLHLEEMYARGAMAYKLILYDPGAPAGP